MSDLTEVPDLMGKLDAAIAVVRADEREKALADAKARIGRLAAPNGSYGEAEWGFLRGVTAALAALTQPQTEIHINSESEPSDEDKAIVGDLVNRAVDKMKHDGGGAAAAAGVADADLEGDEPSETEAVARVKAVMKAGRDAGSGVFDSNSVFRFGTHGVAALLNFLERDGWEVIHTGVYAQPQKWIQAEAELEDQPGPYAKAFREKFPVPEFPGIKNRQEDQA